MNSDEYSLLSRKNGNNYLMKRQLQLETKNRKRILIPSTIFLNFLVNDVLVLIFWFLKPDSWRRARLVCRKLAEIGRQTAVLKKYFFKVPLCLDGVLRMPLWIRYVTYTNFSIMFDESGKNLPTKSKGRISTASLPRLQAMLGAKLHSDHFVVNLDNLVSNLTNVRTLEVKVMYCKNVITEEQLTKLTNLNCLTISRCGSDVIHFDSISVLTGLTSLHDSRLSLMGETDRLIKLNLIPYWTWADENKCRNLSNIEALTVASVSTTALNLLPKLRSLECTDVNHSKNIELAVYTNLRRLKIKGCIISLPNTLEELELNISPLPESVIDNLPRLNRLLLMHPVGPMYSEEAPLHLLIKLPQLEYLSIEDYRGADGDFLFSMTNLVSLRLVHCRRLAGTEDSRRQAGIVDFRRFTRLRYLEIRNCSQLRGVYDPDNSNLEISIMYARKIKQLRSLQ